MDFWFLKYYDKLSPTEKKFWDLKYPDEISSLNEKYREQIGENQRQDKLLELERDRRYFLERRKCDDLPWLIILREKEIAKVVSRLAQTLDSYFSDLTKPLVIVGILKGVYVFLSDLTKKLTIPNTVYFIEASSYKDQKQGEVEFATAIVPSKIKDRHVLLLDELFDNGHTMQAMKQALLQHPDLELRTEDITTCVLFSKNSGTKLPQPDFVGIGQLPNVWLVGYGLDDNGEKRGWPHLFAVPKAEGMPLANDDALFTNEDAYARIRSDLLEKIHHY